MAMELSAKARALILEFEGIDQPSKWPGASSGITLGYGFDLGYQTRKEFIEAWSRHLTGGAMQALSAVIGVTGTAAKSKATRFRAITITKAAAEEVFTRCTVPRILKMVQQAFPGVEKLAADAAGALASLVYNRGTAMTGDTRKEMAQIRTAIKTEAPTGALYEYIAGRVQAMKRLPTHKQLKGLQRRRDAEAALIRSCIA